MIKNYVILLLTFSATALAAPSSNRTLPAQFIKNGSNIMTVPAATDTFAGKATTDTFTNKSIDAATNTLTGITNSSISSSAAIDFTKLATLTNGNILIGNVSNQAASVAVTGDVLITNAGVTSYNNVIPIAKGGTNNASLAVGAGGVLYTDGSKVVNGGAGLSGQALVSTGSSLSWLSTQFATFQTLTSGTTYGLTYVFTVTSASATVNATYRDNTNLQTCTVYATIASATTLICSSSTGAPAAFGTLTKQTGSGDSTITYSSFIKPLWLEIYLVAGGGGGGGMTAVSGACSAAGGGASGAAIYGIISNPSATYTYAIGAGGIASAGAGLSGGNGGATTFNSSLNANGGLGGGGDGQHTVTAFGGTGGVGQTASGGIINVSGQSGQGGVCLSSTSGQSGAGGNSPYGPGGITSQITNAGAGSFGSNGTSYGGGASGSTSVGTNVTVKAGGTGGPGAVWVIEHYAY